MEVPIVDYKDNFYINSPEREILTPEGCRYLLQIGDKQLRSLVREGLPCIRASNSYRFVRRAVIDWLHERSMEGRADG